MESIENVRESDKIELKENILNNMKIVTDGIIKDLHPNNSYSSWKNSYNGMKFIKNDKKKFYMALNMWIYVTENQLIGTTDIGILETMKNVYSWIGNLLEIKQQAINL